MSERNDDPPGSAHVQVGEDEVRLRIELWRNVQPGAAETPLMAVVTAEASDAAELDAVAIEELVLTHGDRTWTGTAAEEIRLGRSGRQFTFRGGPSWPADALVQVTLRLRTAEGVETVPLEDVPVRLTR